MYGKILLFWNYHQWFPKAGKVKGIIKPGNKRWQNNKMLKMLRILFVWIKTKIIGKQRKTDSCHKKDTILYFWQKLRKILNTGVIIRTCNDNARWFTSSCMVPYLSSIFFLVLSILFCVLSLDCICHKDMLLVWFLCHCNVYTPEQHCIVSPPPVLPSTLTSIIQAHTNKQL